MAIYIGSAKADENGKARGGKAGDNKVTSSTFDVLGEVSIEPFYNHRNGWNVLRAKDINVSNKLAESMYIACNNKHIGYNQDKRLGVVNKGINTTTNTEADCSSLVRACIKNSTNTDVGNFTTYNEKSILEKSGIFEKAFRYENQRKTPLYDGDVLVTTIKGHTAIVVSGNPRVVKTDKNVYYPAYKGNSASIIDGLKNVGERDTSLNHRKQIAIENGFTNYSGKGSENHKMLDLLKKGKLIKA